jgi:hypothetical protein
LPEFCNFALNDSDTTSYGCNYLSLTLPGQRQQSFSYLNDDIFTAVILEETQKLYIELTTKLTNEVMTAAAADIRAS